MGGKIISRILQLHADVGVGWGMADNGVALRRLCLLFGRYRGKKYTTKGAATTGTVIEWTNLTCRLFKQRPTR